MEKINSNDGFYTTVLDCGMLRHLLSHAGYNNALVFFGPKIKSSLEKRRDRSDDNRDDSDDETTIDAGDEIKQF